MVALMPLVLAGTVADRELRDAIAGDLLEEHAERSVSAGRGRANWWLLLQLVHSFPYFASLSGDRDANGFTPQFIRRFYARLIAVIGIGVAVHLAVAWLHNSFASSAGVALSFLGGLLGACGAAYGAAVAVPAAPLAAALATGVVAAFAGAGAALLGDVTTFVPEWIALQSLLPFAALAGGLVRARQLC